MNAPQPPPAADLPDGDKPALPPGLLRYARQIACPQIGPDGQRRLRECRLTLIGCGALGSHLASLIVRAGIGCLRLVDRDFIEIDNLQRQTLFDEDDIAAQRPKAEAAAVKLRRANSTVDIECLVADAGPGNIESLCAGADLILDGTDNVETRYLINDVAVKLGRPWVYGACIATEGRVMPILPGRTPCLRCLWEEPPPPASLPTCETAGILASTVAIVASLQFTEAIKILLGRYDELAGLMTIDTWRGRMHSVNVQTAREASDCPCCQRRVFDFLEGRRMTATAALCGRDAIQVLPGAAGQLDLADLAVRLPAEVEPSAGRFMLRFHTGGYTVSVFHDGRAIVQGTTDPAVARSILARFVGH